MLLHQKSGTKWVFLYFTGDRPPKTVTVSGNQRRLVTLQYIKNTHKPHRAKTQAVLPMYTCEFSFHQQIQVSLPFSHSLFIYLFLSVYECVFSFFSQFCQHFFAHTASSILLKQCNLSLTDKPTSQHGCTLLCVCVCVLKWLLTANIMRGCAVYSQNICSLLLWRLTGPPDPFSPGSPFGPGGPGGPMIPPPSPCRVTQQQMWIREGPTLSPQGCRGDRLALSSRQAMAT